ncbi:MAG: hypothetical protein IKE38_01685 [Erysipelotrichaceae bacterium]|nr:hypothetical protein [Erysipelotrichaceae bacterium]
MIGHQLLILANYQGYSEEFKMPMVYLKSVFDKETGKTTDSVFYRFAELEEFYISDKKEEKKEENKDTIRPEIKEAIDAYEAFIDEYCDFMKIFAESDMTDAKLLMEYSEFVSKELEMTEKIEALEEDMTDAEEAYYVEVMLRCSAKMLEAAQ